MPASASDESEPSVPFSRVTAFVRQLSHDVRNGLNAIDLHAALLVEISSEPEVTSEAKRLRRMVTDTTQKLQALSVRLGSGTPTVISLPGREFVESFRERAEKPLGADAAKITWHSELGPEEFNADYEQIIAVLLELLRNALHFRHGEDPVEFLARVSEGAVEFAVRNRVAAAPQHPPETWGGEPFISTRRGGYGLGLYYVRRVVGTIGGSFHATQDPERGVVTSCIRLPVLPAPGSGAGAAAAANAAGTDGS